MRICLGRLLSIAVTVLAPVLVFAGINTTVAMASTCPNEQLRNESNINPATQQPYSTQLPDCRAYELVSPADTGGWEAPSDPHLVSGQPGVSAVATPNGTVLFESQATPAGTGALENGRYERVFRSVRTPAGWSTRDMHPTSIPGNVFLYSASTNGARALVKTTISFSPADLDNPTNDTSETGYDMYVIAENEAPQLVTHGELPDLEEATRGAGGIYPNAELTAVSFVTDKSLARPKVPTASTPGCYIWTDSGPRFAQLTNPDEIVANPGTNCQLFATTAIGSAIIKNETGYDGIVGTLYATLGAFSWGGDNIELAAASPGAEFRALSPNGTVVYITTEEKRTSQGANDNGADLYAISLPITESVEIHPTPPADAITCISCEAEGSSIANSAGAQWVGQSADGSHVFFKMAGALYEHGPEGIQELAPANAQLEHLVFSENGRYVIASTPSALSPSDTNGSEDIYEFSAGAAPKLITSGVITDGYQAAAVSNDGEQIVYGTEASGVPQVIDEWFAGQVGQISPFGSTQPYTVLGTSGPELEDVFFVAHDSLVAQDRNAGTTDIYDARLDGGFAAPTEPGNVQRTPNPQPPSTPPYGAGLAPSNAAIPVLPLDTARPTITSKTKSLTKAQDLSRALKACKKYRSKARRQTCERAARKKYATARKKAKK